MIAEKEEKDMKFKAAAIQIETGSDKKENVEKALRQLDLAAQEGVKLACLHEYFNTECPEVGTSNEVLRATAETIPGPTIDALAKKAKEHQMYIAAGSILEIDQNKFHNTSAFIDPKGNIIGKYRKTHPENAGAKHEIGLGITPGKEYPVFDTEVGKVGIMIDVDGSVPSVVEVFTMKEVEIICWPLNWSARWVNSVEYLPSAHGMFGRCYIVCANRVGRRSKGSQFNHLTYHGSSRIADPEGNVIAKARNFFDGMAVATIDTDFIKLWRSDIIPREYPLRRRPDTYQFIAQVLKNRG
jgi:predicted amidohydrolase